MGERCVAGVAVGMSEGWWGGCLGGVAERGKRGGKSTATRSSLLGGRLLAPGEIHPAEPTLINHPGG